MPTRGVQPDNTRRSERMQCKGCGMKYDGPPENFPKSGYCPLCDPAREADRQHEADVLAAFERADREREETYRESFVE